MYDDFFYKRLAQLRINKGVSARDMSISLGQGAGYINNIENKNALPSMSAFFNLCDYLEITPKEFFDEANIHPVKINELTEDLMALNSEQLDVVRTIVKELKKVRRN
ncbi:MAG: helix-turn-helix transcriptional regulator [Oscillospiraceae bacterium]|nr:helix-turn-helix transcriptional regulator [Oscillospiraceae bacterium]